MSKRAKAKPRLCRERHLQPTSVFSIMPHEPYKPCTRALRTQDFSNALGRFYVVVRSTWIVEVVNNWVGCQRVLI